MHPKDLGLTLTVRMYTGAVTAGTELDQNGQGGPASALGKSSIKAIGMQAPRKAAYANIGAGKLSKSGATTKSESLARLRGKGALA